MAGEWPAEHFPKSAACPELFCSLSSACLAGVPTNVSPAKSGAGRSRAPETDGRAAGSLKRPCENVRPAFFWPSQFIERSMADHSHPPQGTFDEPTAEPGWQAKALTGFAVVLATLVAIWFIFS